MFTLGIKPSFGYVSDLPMWGTHDPGACLLDDGKIVAAAEEERFTREKHGFHTFPVESIRFVINNAGIKLDDIGIICVGRNPRNRQELLERFTGTRTDGLQAFYDRIGDVISAAAAYEKAHIEAVDDRIANEFSREFTGDYIDVSHHACHAASAHFCSGFDEQVTITVDGQGEHDSTVLWDPQLQRVREFSRYNSVGKLYSDTARYLGFRGARDAGKVMGLAPYGHYNDEIADGFSEIVSISKGGYDVTPLTLSDDPIALLEELFGSCRKYADDFEQRHRDVAHHLQLITERIVIRLVKHHVEAFGIEKVALAGGVAMNCKTNRKVRHLDCVDELFVQPVANDSGICLGAALLGYRKATGNDPDVDFSHLYHGSSYNTDDVKDVLDNTGLSHKIVDSPSRYAAEALAEGKLVGWFQGRMEFGARALGNRSILADPTDPASVDSVNKNVKKRENWRPFAPSVLAEATDEYLVDGGQMPYMIMLDKVVADKRKEVPAITHVDGTTRPQTVHRETNERYHKLIREFAEITSCPMVLNTSFNVAGEPIVEHPVQAVHDFLFTGLDILVIEDVVIDKVG